ncbi:hypothetical protein [Sphingobium sp. BS19]|uniref:hypothetical protein n=1 Tax=Sphingobium sp. BS19 TaxID=3018973 RepID=UPI0022EEB3B0|nr:hypothetical protein [Sphingobium sp. BS19]GLI99143.1 hypothetical protein Sbs19_29610 [Sphingobium sp. BS19]
MTMPYITDHAVLRYLERVRGIDMESVPAEMSCAGLATEMAFGCNTVKMGNGARLRIVGDVVQTVLPKGSRS